jgi:uncharacterized membrane protein YfcA
VSAKAILLGLLAAATVAFIAWGTLVVRAAQRRARASGAAGTTPATDARSPGLFAIAVGAVTNFFDTLGIGSFATTTAIWRARRAVDDRLIPGTLNVGHTLPTFAQAIIYTQIVAVDMTTLVLMIAASVVGSWLGAGIVAGWPKRRVQLGMAIALLAAAGFLVRGLVFGAPTGGATLGLSGGLLAAGIAANVLFGALMTIGIGAYAPIMVTVSLLGMNPDTAFPIMMGSCAFLMPVASVRFIKSGSYDLRAALGLALGGVPAVLIAAYIVKSLPLAVVKWLVVAVVLYTAVTLFLSARSPKEPS